MVGNGCRSRKGRSVIASGAGEGRSATASRLLAARTSDKEAQAEVARLDGAISVLARDARDDHEALAQARAKLEELQRAQAKAKREQERERIRKLLEARLEAISNQQSSALADEPIVNCELKIMATQVQIQVTLDEKGVVTGVRNIEGGHRLARHWHERPPLCAGQGHRRWRTRI